jgi:hypothetical protein
MRAEDYQKFLRCLYQLQGEMDCNKIKVIEDEARQYLAGEDDLLQRFEGFFTKTCQMVDELSGAKDKRGSK